MKSFGKYLNKKLLVYFLIIITLTTISAGAYIFYQKYSQQTSKLRSAHQKLEQLKSEDQYVRNENLQEEIGNIKQTYQKAISVYEEILEAQDSGADTDGMQQTFAETLSLLVNEDYAGAKEKITQIENSLEQLAADREQKAQEEAQKLIAEQEQNQIAINNQPPASGYSQQAVQTDIGVYTVDIIVADLGSTRVIVDTASTSDCVNDCPVLALADYVARNGAFAGVNGSYFCPASYPSCAGKTNSFDTLLMNKDKTYFNSDNNVYSSVPAVIFGNGYIRFVGASSQWGRDTSIDSMIANQPLLVSGGNNVFAGDSDPKKGVKAGRSFVANKGNTVYIGVVRNASVAEAGMVLSTMGMENALNLDSGGSTALWYGGYKVGPGRNIPNAILFVRK